MDIEVRDLRLVTAVAATGSLARASEELHVTPSALSHQLRRLEGLLGTRLFVRTDRGMRLTRAGERLFGSARAVLMQLVEAEHAVRTGERSAGPLLRLALEGYTCYGLLPLVLQSFRERYPTVQVQIDTGPVQHPLHRLTAGELDVAVMISTTPARSMVTSRSLFVDDVVALVPADHPLANRRFLEPDDLAHETILLWISPERSTPVTRFLEQVEVAAREIKVVPPIGAAIALVKARLGVALLPRRAASPHMNDGALQALSLGAGGLRQQWSVVTPRLMAPSAHVQEFVRLLVEHAGERDAPHVVTLRRLRSERRIASGSEP